MKAVYPYKRCTKVLKIVSMIVVLWGVCYHVSGHLACDHLLQSVYAQEVAEAPSLIKAIEVNEVEKRYSRDYKSLQAGNLYRC